MRIHMYSASLLVLGLLALAPACEGTGDDGVPGDGSDGDGDQGAPDAAAPGPDAPVPEIDAAPGEADAGPVTPEPDAAAPLPVSFSADIVPILLTRCGGCHLKATGGSGGLSFGVQAELAWDALVDQDTVLANPACADKKRVDPANADPMMSSLYEKLVGTTCGKRMPAGATAVPLDDAQIDLFARWIAAGAPNN